MLNLGFRLVKAPSNLSLLGIPVLQHDFKNQAHQLEGVTKTFDELITFARSSTVNGWTLDANGDPVLTEFAIDQPAFVIDPATGQALGYRALQGFTNSLLWNRDLNDPVWDVFATVTQDQVGLDGVANKAWRLVPSSSSSLIRQFSTVADDTSTHTVAVRVRKNTTRRLSLQIAYSGGTNLTDSVAIDTNDGSLSTTPFNGGSYRLRDRGDWYFLSLSLANNGTGNTDIRIRIYPDASGNNDTAVIDFPAMHLNSSIAGPPIETEGAPESTAADDATESVPASLQSAGTLVVSARTANGLSGDQVLAQMDDGTENNRVRLVRNSSREVRYIVTDGGTEVANLNLGTVADDTDTKVAIRYGDDDYAGIISGGTLQSDATGTMPSISTLRHGRDTADGDEWNGTIANVRGDDAYTDAQLEGAV